MSWVSLICLLALTSSAFGHYGNAFRSRVLDDRVPMTGYGATPQLQTGLPSLDQTVMLQQTRPISLPTQTGYGQQTNVDMPTIPLGIQQDTQFQQVAPVVSSNYGTVPQLPIKKFNSMNIQTISQNDQSYGTPTSSFVSNIQQRVPLMDVPRSFGLPRQQFEQQLTQQQIIPTPADMMCQGQRPETVIPLDGGRRFVVCIDIGKGVEQSCPKGLYYHPDSRRCERKLGPLESPCATQPCLNGGQCVPTDVSSYQCQCPTGFDGKTCELDARVCHTQQPCGQTPDSRCQSFRLGAALQHVCICGQETAYGLSCQQAIPSPCTGVDGPHPLSFTNKGFIMCDGERMFVESCPGGTIWDDLNKACVWPDMQGVVAGITLEDQSYGSLNKLSYGQRPQLEQSIISSYAQRPQLDQSVISTFGQRPQLDQSVISSYGQQKIPSFVPRPALDQVSTSSYGGSVQIPQQIFQKPTLPLPQAYNFPQRQLPKMQQIIKQQELLPQPPSSGY